MSVYFATCREANAVKIGSSHDPRLRMKEVQTGCPFEVTLEAVLPGGAEKEHEFHRRFADDRLKGEWFKITPMIDAIIAANPAPVPEVQVPLVDPRYKPPSSFSNTLTARVREHLKITQVELARRLGIDVTICRNMEAGYGSGKIPTPEVEEKLNALLEAA